MNFKSGSDIMILGSGGQLGSELHKLYRDAICYDHSPNGPNSIDFQNLERLETEIINSNVKWVLNSAAFTNVDACETNKELAYKVNGLAVRTIVRASKKINANLLHVSTDYIFDGSTGHYKEYDFPNPVNYYGISKLIGETFAHTYEKSIIVRTSGVYGSKNNFPNFVYKNLKESKRVKVLDGYYSPIHATNLALAIKSLIENNRFGLYNVAGIRTSRLDLALQIAMKYNFDSTLIERVDKIESFKAVRPFDSSLDISSAKKIFDFDFYSYESNLRCLDNTISGS